MDNTDSAADFKQISFIPEQFDLQNSHDDNAIKSLHRGYRPHRLHLNILLDCVWSPCVFEHGRRRENAFIHSDFCVLDFDHGYRVEEAVHDYCDMKHVIGITRSHTDDHHKFRLIVPWERRITDLATYRFNMERLVDSTGADPQCKDGARFFFPCREIISVVTEGYSEDVNTPTKAWMRRYNTPYQVPDAFVGKGVVPSRTRSMLKVAFPVGERNSRAYMVAKDLLRAGFPHEEVLDTLMANPAFGGTVGQAMRREIDNTIASAGRALRKEKHVEEEGEEEAVQQ